MATTTWLRGAIGFAVVLGGMLVVGGWLSASSWCWPMYLLVGVVAGVVAGSGRGIWLLWVAAVAVYPAAAWLGLPHDDVARLHWFALTLVGACLATAGFAIGVAVAGPLGIGVRRGAAQADKRAIGWPAVVAAVAVGFIGFGS